MEQRRAGNRDCAKFGPFVFVCLLSHIERSQAEAERERSTQIQLKKRNTDSQRQTDGKENKLKYCRGLNTNQTALPTFQVLTRLSGLAA